MKSQILKAGVKSGSVLLKVDNVALTSNPPSLRDRSIGRAGAGLRDKSSEKFQGSRRTGSTGRSRRRLSTAGEAIGFESDGVLPSHFDQQSTAINRDSRGGVVMSISSLSKAGKVPGNPNKTNQDRSWVIESFDGSDSQKFCGVADGHGVHGHEISEKVRIELGRFLEAQPDLRTNTEAALFKAHQEMNRAIMDSWLDVSFSGTTSVSVLIRESKLFCANLGDSRAVLGSTNSDGTVWEAAALSTDHKPDDAEEQARILSQNGRVMAYRNARGDPLGPARVWLKTRDLPGLAMSRSFGDRVASSVGVIAEPTITQTDLTRNHKIIVIASDGIWEFLTNEQVIDIVSIYYKDNDPKSAVEDLCKCAADRWMAEEDVIDDITAVVVFLRVP